MRNIIWLLLFPLTLLAQTATNESGKSTSGLKLPEKEELRPFKYEPVDLVFWAKVEELLLDKNYPEIVYLGAENMEVFDVSTPEYAEGKLAIGIALHNMKFTYAATILFMDIAKDRIGTQLGYSALNQLDQITQTYYYDPKELTEDFLNSYEFGDLPSKIQSFVSYNQAVYNSAYGFDKWATPEYGKIHKFSYWHFQWMYLSALAYINKNVPETALQIFKAIADDPMAPQSIKDKANINIARLIFEEGQFEQSLELYNQLALDIREKGRVLLERAWATYYLKDYSQALGMLRALEAPYFDASINSESYILEMVIYKQLCHYETVIETVDRFNNRFKSAFDTIQKRRPLEGNETIARMALMEYDIQDQANFVDQLRREYDDLKAYNWKQFPFFEDMLSKYVSKDKEMQIRLKDDVIRKSPRIAEDLLDAKEQVDFLDYSAKLDALRIVRKGENRNYTSEKINYLKFDTMFWLFGGEYWLDELPDFKVLITSQCDNSNYNTAPEKTNTSGDEGDF